MILSYIIAIISAAMVYCAPIIGLIVLYRPSYETLKNILKPLVWITPLAILAYCIWQWNSPYPFNWDMYEHQTLINTMLSRNFHILPSYISDTFGFNGYSTLFHTLIALSQWLLKPDIIPFWHSVSVFHLVFLSFVSYRLTCRITKDTNVALIATLACIFFFDSIVSLTGFFLIPQTFTAFLFLFFIDFLFRQNDRGITVPVKTALILACVLILLHFIVGTMGAIIFIMLFVYLRQKKYASIFEKSATEISHLIEKTKKTTILISSLLFGIFSVLIIGLFTAPHVNLGFINAGEAAEYTYTIAQKVDFMRQSYGYFLLLFLPFGVWNIVKNGGRYEKIALLIGTSLSLLIAMQLPYVLKFYTLDRFFIHLIFASGIVYCLKLLRISVKNAGVPLIISMCFVLMLVYNSATWKSALHYNGITTHISPAEIEGATFLKDNYNSDTTLIISDPATQYILETLSYVNSQGGAYADIQTRRLLQQSIHTPDMNARALILSQIKDKIVTEPKTRLFIASGRYFLWAGSSARQQTSLGFNIWYPVDLTHENLMMLRYYNYSQHFVPVFKNSAMTIFEIVN